MNETKQAPAHWYACGNKRCRERGAHVKLGCSPSEFRRATGDVIRCFQCAAVLTYQPAYVAPRAPCGNNKGDET